MTWIKAILQALGEIFKAWNTYQLKKAGADERDAEEIKEIDKLAERAEKTRNTPVSDDDIDDYLLHRSTKSNERRLPRI